MRSILILIIALLLFFGCVAQPEIQTPNETMQENISKPAVPMIELEKNETNETDVEEPEIPLLGEATGFAESTSTYAFDGDSLQLRNYSNGIYEFAFNSSNSGYGNRSQGFLDGKQTAHELFLWYNGSAFDLALVDGIYDEIHAILLVKDCPRDYREYEWEEGSFCYRPSSTDGIPCSFSRQCEKGACEVKSSGQMGPRGVCSDYMYGCRSWLYDQEVTRVDLCTPKDYPG